MNRPKKSTNSDGLRISIITSLQGGLIGQAQIKMLSRFPEVLRNESSDIFVVSGWKLTDAKNTPIETGDKKSSMTITSLRQSG